MKTTITTHTARTAHANASLAPMARAEGSVVGPSNAPATAPKRSARAYEGFLKMPVAVVLVAMWVGGAALLGSCALVLCMAGSLLVSGIAGAL
jgi:hypothetical protein